ETFDVVQSFHDEALTSCPTCDAPVRKVFGSVGIVFKGSGFYITDYRKKEPDSGGNGSRSESDSKSDSKPGVESKSESGPKQAEGSSEGSSPGSSRGGEKSADSGSPKAADATSGSGRQMS
ncbi:MAG: FmdB family zinc ribbon protein, partial [Candidatus Dormibacteraceae bacterium]